MRAVFILVLAPALSSAAPKAVKAPVAAAVPALPRAAALPAAQPAAAKPAAATAAATAAAPLAVQAVQSAPARAQEPRAFDQAESLNAAIREKMQREGVTGLSMAVMRDGQLIYQGSFGMADARTRRLVRADTPFRVASISKMLTAVAIHKLVDQKKLGLDEKVVDVLPWLKFDAPKRELRKITVGMLLSHTSGIARDTGIDLWMNPDRLASGNMPKSGEQRRASSKQPLVYEPGARLRYSNMGYWLLGEIVAARGGARGTTSERRYAAYIKEKILKPLGMRETNVDVSVAQRAKMPVPYGLADEKSGVRPELPQVLKTQANAPGWGLVTTPRDFLKFLSWLDAELNAPTGTLLSADAVRRLTTVVARDRNDAARAHTQGLIAWDAPGGRRIGHTGTFPGFRAAAFLDPARHFAAVVTMNTADSDREGFIDLAFKYLADAFSPSKPEAAPRRAAVPESFPYPQIVRRYENIATRAEIAFDAKGALVLKQGPISYSLTLLRAEDDNLAFRIGDEGPYTSWIGEELVIELDEKGAPVKAMVGASYRLTPL